MVEIPVPARLFIVLTGGLLLTQVSAECLLFVRVENSDQVTVASTTVFRR